MNLIDCPHGCGAVNDIEATKHEGCCHNCREDIPIEDCYRCGFSGFTPLAECPKCGYTEQ